MFQLHYSSGVTRPLELFSALLQRLRNQSRQKSTIFGFALAVRRRRIARWVSLTYAPRVLWIFHDEPLALDVLLNGAVLRSADPPHTQPFAQHQSLCHDELFLVDGYYKYAILVIGRLSF